MKVVIPGGSGHLGTLLARSFREGGHEVVVISRNRGVTRPWRWVGWDGRNSGPWVDEIEGSDAVIHLAGRSVDCRYTKANRSEMMRSRVESVRAVGQAIESVKNPPHVWLQASSATIYAHRFDAPNDEHTGIIGGSENDAPKSWRFSIDVARAWEHELDEARTPRTRKVKMRTAIVMNAGDGGPFDIYLRLVRLSLGGAHGDGRQFLSWVHSRDFVRAVSWLIDRRFVDGVVNIASPNPLRNAEFLRELRKAWGRSVGLPATKLMLEVAAFFYRTETELLLKSRRVVPARLLESGFRFDFPTWPEAALDLCEEWRRRCERTISVQSQPVL